MTNITVIFTPKSTKTHSLGSSATCIVSRSIDNFRYHLIFISQNVETRWTWIAVECRTPNQIEVFLVIQWYLPCTCRTLCSADTCYVWTQFAEGIRSCRLLLYCLRDFFARVSLLLDTVCKLVAGCSFRRKQHWEHAARQQQKKNMNRDVSGPPRRLPVISPETAAHVLIVLESEIAL